MITTLHGDCIELLQTLAPASVQCIVTSPPYWGLRRYTDDPREIGNEPTPAEYVAHLVAVFDAASRVLRDDGTLWLNLGDSYANDTKWGGRTSGKHAGGLQGTTYIGRNRHNTGLPSKSLVGIPWRVAFALQDAGWVLRSDIIWHKPNPMPERVGDRPTRAHEYLFLFSKQPQYYYNADAIAEPAVSSDRSAPREPRGALGPPQSGRRSKQDASGIPRYEGFNERWMNGRVQRARALELAREKGLTQEHIDAIRAAGITDTGKTAATQNGTGRNSERVLQLAREAKEALGGYYREFLGGDTRNRRSVWTIATRGITDAHFAIFPEALVEPCILAGSRPGDTVLDMFAGSGTTLRVAERFGRNSIGIDLNADYIDLQTRRTDGVQIEMEAYL